MLREQMEKVDDMKEKMSNVNIEIKTLGKNQKEMVGNQYNWIRNEKCLWCSHLRLNTDKERIDEIEDWSI